MREGWRRFTTRQWMGTHALVLFAVALFLLLGWWQAIRAGEGNARSIGYALEWPTFAMIVLFLWIRAMRNEARNPELADKSRTHDAERDVTPDPIDEATDPELAAYNRYLSDLHRQDLQSRR